MRKVVVCVWKNILNLFKMPIIQSKIDVINSHCNSIDSALKDIGEIQGIDPVLENAVNRLQRDIKTFKKEVAKLVVLNKANLPIDKSSQINFPSNLKHIKDRNQHG